MIKILITSVLFFFLEILAFQLWSPVWLNAVTQTDVRFLTFSHKQRRVIHYIHRIQNNNQAQQKAVYVMGGSTAREFFPSNEEMEQLLGLPFCNAASANQTIPDMIRLIDNIDVPGSTVVFCLFPLRIFQHDDSLEAETKYLMGQNLKYPIQSEHLEAYLANVRAENMVISLLKPLNVYLYLLRDFFAHKSYRANDPIFHWLLQTPRSGDLGDLITHTRPPAQFLYKKSGYHDRDYIRWRLTEVGRTKIRGRLEGNLTRNFSHLHKAWELATSKGLDFVILELPYSRTFREIYEEELSSLEDHLETFLENHPKTRFAKINYELYGGREALFVDHGHLMDKGRKFFYPHMMNILQNEFHLSSQSS